MDAKKIAITALIAVMAVGVLTRVESTKKLLLNN